MLAVQRVRVGGPALDREDDVVGDHRRMQAQPLAFARQGENAVARRRRAAGRKIEAVAHRGPPCSICCTCGRKNTAPGNGLAAHSRALPRYALGEPSRAGSLVRPGEGDKCETSFQRRCPASISAGNTGVTIARRSGPIRSPVRLSRSRAICGRTHNRAGIARGGNCPARALRGAPAGLFVLGAGSGPSRGRGGRCCILRRSVGGPSSGLAGLDQGSYRSGLISSTQ